MAVQGGEDVYVTLLTTDTYLPGALVLAHSLRDARTAKKLAVLVTLDSVSAAVVTQLKAVYDYIIPVPRIKNDKPANLHLMNRPDLHSAFTKINLWKLTQFRRIVYIDADVVAYRAPDELFDLPHAFAAAPDIGWPDLFNTGVMALTPNMGDYYALLAMAERGISFDGADQGLLNMHFQNSYHRLPFTYNVTPSAHYQYIPAYRHFQSSINMVHFIGTEKPWFQGRDASTGGSPFDEMSGRWWAVYDRHYRKDTTTQAAPPAPTEPQQPPEIVQYFVKGEFQPRVSFVVPVGEPPPDTASSSHGQPHPPQHQPFEHHHGPPDPHYYPPQPQHEHHRQGHEEHQGHHEPPPPHHAPEQSQPASAFPPAQSFSDSSVSFSSGPEAKAEAREEQVQEHQQWAPPPLHEPERRPEPPQQRPMEPSWDAQRQAPPAYSKPEALNFPQTHYEMSSDAAPFVPPERYPSPPRNMYYEVPKEPPAPARTKPPPIFPWESHRPRASRVFVDDEALPEPSVSEESRTESLVSSGGQRSEPVTPTTPTIRVSASNPWTSFTRTNAWDEVPEIERYVDSLQQKHRRNKSSASSAAGLRLAGLGPDQEGQQGLQESFRRRGSKVTDFPSEVERPSLPVTPAPIRRPRFWGGGAPGFGDPGDDDDGLLPAAEGVPQQTDWDPVEQLQKLARQQSEVLQKTFGASPTAAGEGEEQAGGLGSREIPTRPLPFGSENVRSPTYVAQSAVLSPKPVKPPSSSTSPVQHLLASEREATPRSAAEATSMASPSYQGPGVMFEKGEDVPIQGIVSALPTEEERDILET